VNRPPPPAQVFCDRRSVTLVDINLGTIVIPLFTVCFGPAPPPVLPEAPPSSGVHVSQLGQNLTVSWDACKAAQAAVEFYVVCVERSPGAADVGPCTNTGSALRQEYPDALSGARTGDKLVARVRCIAVDGSQAEVASEPVVVDLTSPAVAGLALKRVAPVNATTAPPIPFSMFVSDSASLRLSFTIVPSISCVAVVRYTLSESSDPSVAASFAFELRDAGSGVVVGGPQSTAVTSTSVPTPSLNFSSDAIGWSETRAFDVEIQNAPLVSGKAYYGLVYIATCVGTPWMYRSADPVLYDATPPALVPDDRIPPVVLLEVANDYMFASWPRLLDAESSVVYVSAQFFVRGVAYGPPRLVSDVLSLNIVPNAPLVDGTPVGFNLTVTNGAGTSVVFSNSTVVDTTPPVCTNVSFVGAWAALGFVMLDSAESTTATVTAQVDCVDPHTGISSITMSIG
jgi:hypothetical protein